MIDVVGAEHAPRELLQIVILFVGGVVGADDAESARANRLLEFLGHRGQRLRPRNLFQLAIDAHQRRLQAVGMVVEIEAVAAFDAQELAVDAGAVAIVATQYAVIARAERGFAAVGAVRTNGADVGHLPRPRLATVDAAGERADGANVDAGAALVAL